jgi:recombination protein RecA
MKKAAAEGEKTKVDPRAEEIEKTIKEIKKEFGEGSIMRLGEARRVDVDSTPTGSISLDIALGTGGIPRGRIIEVYGPESSGKTTVALHVVANTQKKGGIAAFIDAEHALDPEYARRIGVDIDNLLISQPDTGEQALGIVEALVTSGGVDMIVVDSVAALTPQAEIEGNIGDFQIGLQARLMSQALRKLSGLTSKSNTTIIFINQIRMKIGVYMGNPETTPGGKALKFYSSVRIEVRRAAQIKKGEEVVGNRVKAKIVKNKVAPPFRTAEFDIMYNEGISRRGDILTTASKLEIVKLQGSWYSFEDKKLGQGGEASKQFLKENPQIEKEIVDKVYDLLKVKETESHAQGENAFKE